MSEESDSISSQEWDAADFDDIDRKLRQLAEPTTCICTVCECEFLGYEGDTLCNACKGELVL